MIGIIETIQSTLSSNPLTLKQIVAATGLEPSQCSPSLTYLKSRGLVDRTERGWIECVPEGGKRAARGPTADKPKRAKTAKSVARKPKTAAPAVINGRACEFAVTERGTILFKITSGPKAGELGEIGCADALALYKLMSAVEFITENA